MRDYCFEIRWPRFAVETCVGILLAARAFAGGSGLNVAVVVNQNSPDSIQLGNYYCEQRGVPPQNVLRISWPGSAVTWTDTEFSTSLLNPLLDMLADRALNSQVEYVLLSMDIPYRIVSTNGENSTTSSLFYGYKTNDCLACEYPGCTLPEYTHNAYAGTEGVFRLAPPVSASSNSWLAMLLTSSNLTQAKALVDRGVAADFSMPTHSVFLAKSDDVNRNVRYALFDNALFSIHLGGVMHVVRTNVNSTSGLGTMLGYANGYMVFPIDGSFAPGAMADNLTSFGGQIFENSGHTDALDFLNAGATASYGTVIEPCNYLAKFPTPMNYFYQARGFSIAECYYQSLTNPYQGILVGEPLSAPFAQPCDGGWSNLAVGAVLSGITNLSLSFDSPSAHRPVQQVDFFLDGQWMRTLTNLPPSSNNILYVTLNGFPTNYPVPANANLSSVASNLVHRLNAANHRSNTKVAAFHYGDRIELQGLDLATPGTEISVVVSNYGAPVLTSFISASRTNFLDTEAFGVREFSVAGALVVGDYLKLTVTKTNGAGFDVAVTNASSNATFTSFVQSLLAAINAEPNLQAPDGVIAEDLVTASGEPYAQFNLRARTAGWTAARIQAQLSGSFSLDPTTAGPLEDNLNDLRPRNHLYLTAGLTNLNLTFPFDTTTNADGSHELTAVAYEGSHVRTQKRISQNVRIQNHSWFATFTTLLGGTNTALEATLQFAVVAHTTNIAKIEFFSTGGLLATSNDVASATFTIAASYLGLGLHPFYALVTRADGEQYRTDTKWIRIIGPELPFSVSILGPAPTLTWPASAGRPYQVLSAPNLTHTFTQHAAVIPTNSIGYWAETNNTAPQRFYRVKTP